MRYDVIVIGAGAAGLMCAITAGQRGRNVVVLERSPEIGRKILISGGGRSNFTNIHCRPDNFVSANPHFAKSALARYTPSDFIDLVRRHRIPYHEKKLGQLFCDRSARDIVNLLLKECEAAGVKIVTACGIQEIRRTTEFVVTANTGEWSAPALAIATGGLSIPKTGATDFGYRIAAQFGLALEPCRAALVPLTFGPEDQRDWSALAGVSTEVIASAGKQKFRENMLFTHRGLSGPAILQVSTYWNGEEQIAIDLAPGLDGPDGAGLRRITPRRLADRWLDLNPLEKIHDWRVTPAGTEGYAKAEVTAGGVSTSELSSQTMEARNVPGLFFVGEVVDVTGQLGGFNFQWAWSSGFAAGQAV